MMSSTVPLNGKGSLCLPWPSPVFCTGLRGLGACGLDTSRLPCQLASCSALSTLGLRSPALGDTPKLTSHAPQRRVCEIPAWPQPRAGLMPPEAEPQPHRPLPRAL